MNSLKWDERFINLALKISKYSKDPSTKAGCVITKGKRIVSTGYNGLPHKIKDKWKWLNNRDIKLQITLHAEENAILFSKQDLTDTTIYTYPFQPCAHCAAYIVQSDIKRVVSIADSWGRWEESCKLARKLFKETNIEFKIYKVKKKC